MANKNTQQHPAVFLNFVICYLVDTFFSALNMKSELLSPRIHRTCTALTLTRTALVKCIGSGVFFLLQIESAHRSLSKYVNFICSAFKFSNLAK